MKLQGNDVKNLIDARRLGEAHGLYIVQKPDCFLIYRKQPANPRGLFIGRRTTTADVLRLIKKAASTKPAQPSGVIHYAN